MASEQDIVIPVSLDEKTFKRFARFDTLRLRKKWVRPAIFAGILIAFAAVALLTRKPESGMIAAVLLTVGLGLPVVYIGMFLSQVNMQALRRKLGKGRRVYTVRLTQDALRVQNDQKKEETLAVPWKETQRAFRVKGCIYLYVSAARAFLLPDGQSETPPEDIWQYLIRRMGAEKCKKY